MKICPTHWIQYRDHYEANQKLLLATAMSAMVAIENETCTVGTTSPEDFGNKIEKESNGCIACFFKARTGKEIFEDLNKKMG